MDELITIDDSVEKSLIDFLIFLLKNEKVSGVFTLRKTPMAGSYDYALITDVGELENTTPLSPLMPANGAQLLSRFTPMKKPELQ